LAKANPGKFSYGSSGAGTAIHLASELFKAAAGVDIVHVPYRGNAGVMPDLLAGRIAMLIRRRSGAGEEHRLRPGTSAGGNHEDAIAGVA
jgi:tripartite-type tricarboxylate transporter receptor subunit TctC